MQKRVGLVVDFVGVLRELKKALQFDSSDVIGVIEDLDLLLEDFLGKIEKAKNDYLDVADEGGADAKLEELVYGRFLDPEPRKAFFEAYKEKDDDTLRNAGVSAMEFSRESVALLARFPNARVNADEQRRLRAALYRPLLGLNKEERGRIVDVVIAILLDGDTDWDA